MNDKRTNLEVIAPSVDEAIEKGLGDLGLPRDSVEIEVLDEGGKGLFGLGNRQARVRLTIKSDTEDLVIEPPAVEEEVGSEAGISTPPVEAIEEKPEDEPPFLGEDYILDIARDVVSELLEKMKVRASVSAEYLPA